jgi:hypothetical protein
MKYTKHLKKLALLSSLALSFGVKADGTLPLPVSQEDLPLAMSGNVEGLSSISLSINNLQNIPNTNPVIGRSVGNPCSASDLFYNAVGTITMDAETLYVRGVCAPATKPDVSTRRSVVATDGSIGLNGTSKKLVLLDGMVAVGSTSTLSSFTGNMKIQPLGLTAATRPVLVPMGLTTMSLTSASLLDVVIKDLKPQAEVRAASRKFQLIRQ